MRGLFLFSLGAIGTTPALSAAWMPERRTVRVTFSVAPKASDANDADDALNKTNWSVVPVAPVSDDPFPYTTVEIFSVRPYADDTTGTVFDLTLDLDPTFGVVYVVSVGTLVAASDPFGMLGSPSSLNVDAFDPSYRTNNLIPMLQWFGRATSDYDSPNRDNARTLSLLDEIVNQVSSVIEGMQEMFDPLRCPRRYLDGWLAALGNPFTEISATMTVLQKRRLCLALVDIYRNKGTAQGIIDAIDLLLGVGVSVHVDHKAAWILGEDVMGPASAHPYEEGHPDASEGECILGVSPSYIHNVLGGGRIWGVRLGGWVLPPNDVGQFFDDPAVFDSFALSHGVTAPKDEGRRGLYSFCLVADRALTDTERAQATDVANYMKPAGTHLRGVFDPFVSTAPTGWILGLSSLGSDTIL